MNQKQMQPKAQSHYQNPQLQTAKLQVPSDQQKPQFHIFSHLHRTSPQKPMPQEPSHYRQHLPQKSEPHETSYRQSFPLQGLNYQQWPKPQGIIGHQQGSPKQGSQGSSDQQHHILQRPQSYGHGYKQNPSLQVPINQLRPQPNRSDNQQNLPKPHAPNNQPNPLVWERPFSDGKFHSLDPSEGRQSVPTG
ncbi:hypothetical protein XENORESO_021017 [Xenotaenia resolanae]|uniref:Uncharacterized protein n=1 Tax=Xenotaenia resolanae TaxID=208358 RepID=A0ABV0VW10_9TELE